MAKLSEAEILERLPTAKGWERHGDMLRPDLAVPFSFRARSNSPITSRDLWKRPTIIPT